MCSAPKEREMCSLPRGASNENLQRNTLLCTQLTPRAFIYSNYSVMKIRQGLHLIRKLRSPFLPLQQVFFMFGECNSCILHELKQQPSGPSGFPLLLADFISFPLLGHFCIFSLSPPQSYFYNFFFSFLCSSVYQYYYTCFFLLHEPSMESHIHILPLAVQSFPFFELFFLFVLFCSSLIASPPSLLHLSQPTFFLSSTPFSQPATTSPKTVASSLPFLQELSFVCISSDGLLFLTCILLLLLLPLHHPFHLTCSASLGHSLRVSTHDLYSLPQTSAPAMPRASELSGRLS